MSAFPKKSISALVLATPIFFSAAALAQSSNGALQGTVTDPSGAAIPGAKVHIVSGLTGVARDVVANQDGFYSAPNLTAGRYTVTVSADGFTAKTESDVTLTVGTTKDFDFPLMVSGGDTSVTVEAGGGQVNTADTSVQGVVDGKQTRDLPLNGRDWTTLATLNTGVSQVLTQFAGAATATTRLSRGLGAQLTIGGNRPQQNSYRLDGVNINDYANGGPGSIIGNTMGVDAVQEFSVITSDANAQYGRMSGGVINSITRQGSSQFHGSVYDFIRNSVFDARGYFDPLSGEPSFRRNQFGATLGGPIIKDKTFFFANYEGYREARGITIQSTTLSANARSGNVTCTQAAAGATQNAACRTGVGSTTVAGPGTAGIQNVGVDARVAPYLVLFPSPNGTVTGNTGQYNFVTGQPANEDLTTLHMDHNFSQNDSLHGTILYDTASVSSADGTNTLFAEAISRRTTAALEETHIFTSRLANSFRLGYNRSVAIAPNTKYAINPSINDPALGFYAGKPVGQLVISGLTTIQGGTGSVGTNAYHYNSYQIYDDATYVIGKHSITFGVAGENLQNNTLGGVLPNGQWSFGSINAFLTNAPTFFEGGLPSTPVIPKDLRQYIAAGYVQDSWQARSNVTLNLGLRYEMATNTTETRGRLGALLTPTSAAATPVNSFFDNNPSSKNFEPRIGIAWDAFKNGKTVITAASGIYDILSLNYSLQLQVLSSAPSYGEGRITGTPAKSFPTNPFLTSTPKLRVIYTPKNPGRSYVIQSAVNVQQQMTPHTVFTLGYIGSHGVRQVFTTNDLNNVAPLGQDPNGNYYFPDLTAFPATSAARQAMILNPAVGTESGTYYNGSSIYHSMQTSLAYNAPRGIVGKVSYTWSKSIDNSSSAVSGASFGNSLAGLPAYDLRVGRGVSDFDLRHVFTANAVAPLPNIKRGGKALSFLRDWTVNNIFSIRSGIPFSPIIGGDPLGLLGSQPFNFPDRIVNNRGCVNPHNLNYIDTSCFAVPAPYRYGTTAAGAPLLGPRFGTAKRNSLFGPGQFFWTAGLMKDQAITERVRAQFQAQAFNVSNHANFSNPAAAQTQIFNASGVLNTTAGLLTSALPGRQLQFSLKILF